MAPPETHLEEALSCLDDQESVKKILDQCDDAERSEVASCIQLAQALRSHKHDLDPSHELLSETLDEFQECREHSAERERQARSAIRAWLQPRSVAVLLVAVIAILGGLAAWRGAGNPEKQGEVAVQTPTTNEPNAVNANTNTASSGTTANSNTVSKPKANANSAPTNAPQSQQPALDTSALATLAGTLGTGLNAYEQDAAALQGLAGDQTLTNAGGDLLFVNQL